MVSSVLFVLAHSSALRNPLAALNTFLVAVFLALWALREGGLYGVAGFHIVWNWAQGSVFGFAVSGREVTGGSLLTLQAHGSSVLSGGDYGPEASIIATVVTLVLLAVVVRGRRRRLPEARRSDPPTGVPSAAT